MKSEFTNLTDIANNGKFKENVEFLQTDNNIKLLHF